MTDRLRGDYFGYVDGHLAAEEVPLARIAEAVGTPCYVYSAGALRHNYAELASALSQLPATICFALKANSNQAVIRIFAQMGAGADVVSEGELRRALAAGVAPEKIVFSGVGKTRAEMVFALRTGIYQINVESEAELETLNAVAGELGLTATVSIRVNPDVDAMTHEKISTGRKQDKFGVILPRLPAVMQRAAELPHIRLVGLAVHIGSQLLSLEPFRRAFEKLAELVRDARANGHTIERLDLGGGLGITYQDEDPLSKAHYAEMIAETVGDLGCSLLFEPGRSLVGDAGVLLTRVLYRKQGGERPIIVVDAAMNDLKRPAMYGAYHPFVPFEAANDRDAEDVDIVGPICETGDTFASRRLLPHVDSGDLLAIGSAGAYGAVMASSYNSRLLVPEVLVDGDRFAVVRARPSYEEMIAQDAIPDWLDESGTAKQRGAA